jgi:hypothetical protein
MSLVLDPVFSLYSVFIETVDLKDHTSFTLYNSSSFIPLLLSPKNCFSRKAHLVTFFVRRLSLGVLYVWQKDELRRNASFHSTKMPIFGHIYQI